VLKYSKKELLQVVKDADLNILECRFFFIFLLPLLCIRHLMYKDNNSIVTTSEANKPFYFNKFFNKLLIWISSFEYYFRNFMPNITGGSILIVAEKKK
jgi:hypothetical protein